MDPFHIEPYNRYDKQITVRGPGDLVFYVDFDDVNQNQVERDLGQMVFFLNTEDWSQWVGAEPLTNQSIGGTLVL